MRNIQSLSFSGGALKGISLCGVLRWLEEQKILPGIKHISGTSVGAFFGLLLNMRYTYIEIKSVILNLDFKRLEDIELGNVFTQYGMASGRKIEILLRAMIKKKGYDVDITFLELFKKTGVKLSLLCCKINDCSQVVFNHENTPDFKVFLACKISTSIPFIWKKNKVGEDYLIDGCFTRNLPIHLHDPETSIGFYLITPESNVIVNTFEKYIMQVISCIFKKGQNLELENCKANGYTVVEISNYNSIFNIDISLDEKTKMIDDGYKTCVDFFNTVPNK